VPTTSEAAGDGRRIAGRYESQSRRATPTGMTRFTSSVNAVVIADRGKFIASGVTSQATGGGVTGRFHENYRLGPSSLALSLPMCRLPSLGAEGPEGVGPNSLA